MSSLAITKPPLEKVNRDITLQTDYSGAKVSASELLQGCPYKDCIPAINAPAFHGLTQTNQWLKDSDIIFALNYKGIQRAYPQRILNWHEIVNDRVKGTPIIITFCPLCGSALAFERTVNGVITEFGVSGKLHDSDLVMYDRYEGNLWQQITGEAIVGPAARRNEILKRVPISTTTWGEWKRQYPKTRVLSPYSTGYDRNYTRYPYGDYERNPILYFPVSSQSNDLHPKAVIYGVSVGNAAIAFPELELKQNPTIIDTAGNTQIQIQRLKSGEVLATDLKTGTSLPTTRLFWFAWKAFYPHTKLSTVGRKVR